MGVIAIASTFRWGDGGWERRPKDEEEDRKTDRNTWHGRNVEFRRHFSISLSVLHLSGLYEIENRALKQQVRRNIERFPIDFLIILTDQEWLEVITICDNLGAYKYAPSPPFAFTEQGVAMLSSVLKSRKAIEANIAIMRTFVQIRKMMTESADLNKRIDSLESRYDEQFQAVFEAIRQLFDKKSQPRRAIGYRIPDKE